MFPRQRRAITTSIRERPRRQATTSALSGEPRVGPTATPTQVLPRWGWDDRRQAPVVRKSAPPSSRPYLRLAAPLRGRAAPTCAREPEGRGSIEPRRAPDHDARQSVRTEGRALILLCSSGQLSGTNPAPYDPAHGVHVVPVVSTLPADRDRMTKTRRWQPDDRVAVPAVVPAVQCLR